MENLNFRKNFEIILRQKFPYPPFKTPIHPSVQVFMNITYKNHSPAHISITKKRVRAFKLIVKK